MLTLHCAGRQVLSVGLGAWGGAITNPSNPQRRDVQIVPANGYAVRSSLSFPSIPSDPFPTLCTHPGQNALTDPTLSFSYRSSNGNKTTPASGPSTVISPGTSRAVFMLISWSGRLISKICSFRRRRIRIVGIGLIIRVGICCRRLIRGCKEVEKCILP